MKDPSTFARSCPISMLRQAYVSGRRLLLLFDFDGTLAPIVDHPRLARLPSATRTALIRLTSLSRVHVGVMSGRQRQDLKKVLDLPNLFVAGTSGLELDFCGIEVVHPRLGNSLSTLAAAADELESLLIDYPGAWLERKPAGMTIHFRHVVGDNGTRLCQRANECLAAYSSRLRVVDGPLALEITAHLGWTKGSAVRMFVQSLRGESPCVLYAGDSANDWDALQAAEDLGGISVGIGAGVPSFVQFRFASPNVLSDWLLRLAISISNLASVTQ